MSKPEPRFGDVYEWQPSLSGHGTKVMVISDDPLAFVTLSSAWPGEPGRVTAFPSNEQKVPFSSPDGAWIRVEGV